MKLDQANLKSFENKAAVNLKAKDKICGGRRKKLRMGILFLWIAAVQYSDLPVYFKQKYQGNYKLAAYCI
jgi:hypothetical protein